MWYREEYAELPVVGHGFDAALGFDLVSTKTATSKHKNAAEKRFVL